MYMVTNLATRSSAVNCTTGRGTGTGTAIKVCYLYSFCLLNIDSIKAKTKM
jgi:hypothetical protein